MVVTKNVSHSNHLLLHLKSHIQVSPTQKTLSPSQLLDAQIFAAPELAPLNLHSPQMRRILNKQLNSLGVYPKIVHNIHIYKAFAAPEEWVASNNHGMACPKSSPPVLIAENPVQLGMNSPVQHYNT